MQNPNEPKKKGIFRRIIAVLIIAAGLLIFLAPTAILVWGAIERWSTPSTSSCEEKWAKLQQDEAAKHSRSVDIQKIESDARDLCKAKRQKDLPIVIAFGFLAFCGLMLSVAGVFLFRGRRPRRSAS